MIQDKDEKSSIMGSDSLSPQQEKDSADLTPSLPAPSDDKKGEASITYPTRLKLALILLAALLSIFLVALDTTIVSTAIPRITDDFHSLDDVGWYASGFFMTMAAFQSVWGKAYKYFDIKTVFLTSVVLFEVGSVICAAAPSSKALIIGRAIAGLGAAGISSGAYLIVGISAPPEKVPALLGLVGAAFAVASVAGPLVGGAFTSNASWRWCFYINLPIGGVAFALIVFFYSTPSHVKPAQASKKAKIWQMDIPGAFILLGAITCLLLALQWGGVTKAWGSPDVIGTLVGLAVIAVAFVGWEYYQGERAAVNGRILKQRTISFQMAYQLFNSGAFFVLLYYLPIYFQVVSGVSAAQSGIRNIPLLVMCSVTAIISGIVISKTGEFQGLMLFGSPIVCVGSGLIYTLGVGSSAGHWVGYQILVGVGIGLTMQIAVTVSQAVVDAADIAASSAMALFFQLLAGAIWNSVAQSLFTNGLIKSLEKNMPEVSTSTVVAAGATELRTLLSGEELTLAIESFMVGLRDAFTLPIALAGAAVVVAAASVVVDRRKLGAGVSAAGAA